MKRNTTNRLTEASLLNRFHSTGYIKPSTNSADEWVTARFIDDPYHEGTLFLGGDNGHVAICSTESLLNDGGVTKVFRAHKCCIMDMVSVPNDSTKLLTVSGDSDVRCWDIEALGSSKLFFWS
ncbi:unnamed protein product [Caenorhabditis auriculariae]|uniref:Uncharacterized protein n=1 Tax=Caenorhabditis auriculariae TaxID=2777116 RepID=A0A8S1H3M2_9PELO|nr:unnamed protein product [Caenorhabditis auriculariae]